MQFTDPIRIGTRKSVLALAQAELVKQRLIAANPDITVELVPMVTSGDRNTNKVLADIGGKGLFVKELEEALQKREIDLAVHSLKDMEAQLALGLMIVATLEREDARDVLIAPKAKTLVNLPQGAIVGTSSPRRAAQIKIQRPDLTIVPFRGNVTTRIEKIKQGQPDATLLALAGLKRINMQAEATEILDVERFMPAAGQGIIAIECAEGNEALRSILQPLSHKQTQTAAFAERQLLRTLGGSCYTPIAGYARLEGEELRLDAMIATPDGAKHYRVTRKGSPGDAVALGTEAAKELLAMGGKECLA
jgi:hydroxymethylbilane synthase